MADVNLSLYPTAKPPEGLLTGDPVRLLGAVGQLNDIQRFQSQRNALDSYRNALRPDGTIDPGQLTQGLRASGATFGAPEVISSGLAQKGQAISNETAQFEQYAKQNDYAAGILSSLANKPDVKPVDVDHAITMLSRNSDPRSMPSSVLNGLRRQLLGDPSGLRSALGTLQNRVAGAGAAANREDGPPGVSGEATSVPRGSLAPGYSQQGLPGQTPVGLPPGSEISARAMQEDLLRSRNYGQEIFPWQQALTKLKELGPGGVGPGTEGRQSFASFMYTLSPTLSRWLPGMDVNSLKNYDEAKKYLTQATMNRLSSFGHGTDQQLATALTGNPNVKITDLAATELTKMAIATRRMEHAQTLASAKAGPAGYTAAAANFAGDQDPRAYAIDLMEPEQIRDLQKNLKGPERDKFNRSLKMAIGAGVVNMPGGK